MLRIKFFKSPSGAASPVYLGAPAPGLVDRPVHRAVQSLNFLAEYFIVFGCFIIYIFAFTDGIIASETKEAFHMIHLLLAVIYLSLSAWACLTPCWVPPGR